MLEDSFPHGTPGGYTLGCKGNHCPGAGLSCSEAATRYRGDWAFRRLVEQGATTAELVAYVDGVTAAGKAADRPARPVKPKQPKPAKEPRDNRVRGKNVNGRRPWTDDEITTLRDGVTDGLSDAAIGRKLGRAASSKSGKRSQMRLPSGRTGRLPEYRHGTLTGYSHGCHDDTCPATPSCGDIGRNYHRKRAAA